MIGQSISDIARDIFLFRFVTIRNYDADIAIHNANELLEQISLKDRRSFDQQTIKAIEKYKQVPMVQRVVIDAPSNHFVDQKIYLSKNFVFRCITESKSNSFKVIHDITGLLVNVGNVLEDEFLCQQRQQLPLLNEPEVNLLTPAPKIQRQMLRSHTVLFNALEKKLIRYSKIDENITTEIEAVQRALGRENEKRRKAKERLKRKRITHCWKCQRDIDTDDDPLCESCEWILCPCGGCGCGFNRP